MSRGRILVVDDEDYIRESVADYLEDEGYEVHVAGSGAEALELARRVEPDLCVLDLRMHGMDGTELAVTLHAERPGLEVLILTGSARVHPTEPLRRIGVGDDRILHKPIEDLGALASRAARILDRRGRRTPGGGTDGDDR